MHVTESGWALQRPRPKAGEGRGKSLFLRERSLTGSGQGWRAIRGAQGKRQGWPRAGGGGTLRAMPGTPLPQWSLGKGCCTNLPSCKATQKYDSEYQNK